MGHDEYHNHLDEEDGVSDAELDRAPQVRLRSIQDQVDDSHSDSSSSGILQLSDFLQRKVYWQEEINSDSDIVSLD